jgi:hypothetical protein
LFRSYPESRGIVLPLPEGMTFEALSISLSTHWFLDSFKSLVLVLGIFPVCLDNGKPGQAVVLYKQE